MFFLDRYDLVVLRLTDYIHIIFSVYFAPVVLVAVLDLQCSKRFLFRDGGFTVTLRYAQQLKRYLFALFCCFFVVAVNVLILCH